MLLHDHPEHLANLQEIARQAVLRAQDVDGGAVALGYAPKSVAGLHLVLTYDGLLCDGLDDRRPAGIPRFTSGNPQHLARSDEVAAQPVGRADLLDGGTGAARDHVERI